MNAAREEALRWCQDRGYEVTPRTRFERLPSVGERTPVIRPRRRRGRSLRKVMSEGPRES